MSATLRILLTTDAVGGVWPYSLDLARGIARQGADVVIAILGPSPSPAQKAAAKRAGARLIDTRLPLDWLSEDPTALSRAGRRLAQIADDVGADLVQLNGAAIAAEAGFEVPVIAVQHSCVATWWDAVRGTPLPADFEWRTEQVRAGLHTADAVVAPTAAFAEAVQRRYGLAKRPYAVHNGRSPLRLPQVAPHDFAFTAGRLWDAGKNVATLDAAAARIGIPLHAAGPTVGPNGASVRLDNIHCLGTIDEEEIGRWLAARPVFVSAALYEPFGLAVLEAAMAGCPLVLSDIPTFRELWDGAAIFVPPTDDAAFARAIGDLAGDDFARAVRGRAAKERATRYSAEAMSARMAKLYRSVVPARPVPDPKLEAKVAA